jgi:hypothetical protein
MLTLIEAETSELSGFGMLSITVGYPATSEVVGRHLDTNAIADQNADAMLAHLARNAGEHYMLAVVETDFKECVGLFVDNRAFRGNQIVFCQ